MSSKSKSPELSSSDLSMAPDDAFTMVDAKISDTEYALRCKELMALHNDLSSLGAADLLDLPRIVVIGGQSAGKSSLVEAVSGISVPRDSGTCTRCPMECSMNSSTEGWWCDIALRFDYDDRGIRLSASRTEAFGPRLTEKSDIDLWLRRAQVAVLSPHVPFQQFISKSLEELREIMRVDSRILKFSKNAICVDIHDPDATVLSFVDLPGLIQNETIEMIELVKSMVVDKIRGENSANTLILITIPMSDDMENQQAVRLAREADPAGQRTIGVLTKPDMLTQGAINARKKWMEVIQGQAHQLKHGYYCVRLLDDQERARKTSRAERQQLEADFFMSESPWSSILEDGRFGVPGFVNDISGLLVDMIEKNLPKLKEDVLKLLENHHLDLARLPLPVTNDPAAEVLFRVTNFCNDLRSAVFGESYKTLAQSNRARYEQFKLDIHSTAPDFRPFWDYTTYTKPFPEDEQKLPISDNSKTYGIREIRTVIKRSISWELPDHVPFEATKVLILEITSQWQGPSIACFNAIFKQLSEMIDHHMNIHFGQFKQLYSFISSLIAKELLTCKHEALRTLTKLLEMEQTPIFTQNTHYLDNAGKKWLGWYSEIHRNRSQYVAEEDPQAEGSNDWGREASLSPNKAKFRKQGKSPQPPASAPVKEALELLHLAGYNTVTENDLSCFLTPDRYREELVIMAKVRAYFEVAYKRIIDYIPLAIEQELNQALAKSLQECIFQAILGDGRGSDEKMKELLSEDPAIGKKRAFLKGRLTMLREIQLKLNEFRRESVAA